MGANVVLACRNVDRGNKAIERIAASISPSNAMHKKKYRTALISLQEIKLSGEVGSAKEGMAVRDSLVNLEEELIYAIENGDKNAQKTYDLLKRVNRN